MGGGWRAPPYRRQGRKWGQIDEHVHVDTRRPRGHGRSFHSFAKHCGSHLRLPEVDGMTCVRLELHGKAPRVTLGVWKRLAYARTCSLRARAPWSVLERSFGKNWRAKTCKESFELTRFIEYKTVAQRTHIVQPTYSPQGGGWRQEPALRRPCVQLETTAQGQLRSMRDTTRRTSSHTQAPPF